MRGRGILLAPLLNPLYRLVLSLALTGGVIGWLLASASSPRRGGGGVAGEEVFLSMPSLRGVMSVEGALSRWRSVKEYLDEPLTLKELGQILWAAYGISETRWGFRTAPSAGAIYPLNVYAVVGERGVVGEGCAMAPGVYKYLPARHSLLLVKPGDVRRQLYEAALRQDGF